jgi:hypothetical protein
MKKEGKTGKEGQRIAWHPAFYDAIRQELEEYRDVLSFEAEHHLTAEPSIIDVVIIKNVKEAEIKKNIGWIFRKVNIIEYKSPEDSLSVRDFHKIVGYTHTYISQNGIKMKDMSITFAAARKAREVLEYLAGECGFQVEERESGIYEIEGYVMPVQILETKKLEENRWLKGLKKDLTAEEMKAVLEEKAPDRGAYYYAVFTANSGVLEEVRKMSDRTFDEFVERVGLADKWRTQGMEQGIEKGVKKGVKKGIEKERNHTLELIEKGYSLEEIKRQLNNGNF